ncbi:ABC transporter substrate-binding protein [Paenibacillus sp. 598K]|uniref:extracellular solute-binding protein n=1 Tax=Paenibacillus sp. 598K TaxID=1117987 RepID=UPI000FF9043F|nr:extracellular solute-binding protein [Paenibacillus sp. 598K]GBF75057.1 ABC transporter substrate-binding protein [Paenibacillus sp. 598K]
MRNTAHRTTVWLFIIALVLVTACSAKDSNEPSSAGSANPPASTEASGDGESASESNANSDGSEPYLAKYDPPIEITTVRAIDDTVKFMEGQTIDNNLWTELLQERLGINMKYDWVGNGDQFEQKMNVSIASGALPQFIPVNAKQLQQLQEAGELEDLTAAYEQYASPFLKEILTQDGPASLAAATFDGKLMAIPNTNSSMDTSPILWIRQDWLDKLGLQPPRTMADVLAISEAFTTRDPDGNGKADTYGLALNKDLYNGFADTVGFMNGYHAYPGQWIKDDDGTIVYGSIQPEMRTALAALQELYKKGQIDREFGVKDGGKEGELLAAGKIGMEYGLMWNPLWPIIDSKKNEPDAQWQAFPLVSVDDRPVTPQVSFATHQYFAVKKGSANPEALVKMINLFVEIGWGETSTLELYNAYFTGDGFEKFKLMPFQAWPARNNVDLYQHVAAAVDSNDPSQLNPQEKDIFDKVMAYANGSSTDPEHWAYAQVFGKESAYTVIDQYVTSNSLKMTEFYGSPTPTMVEKESNLKNREFETFTKIIMGDPIESFDKFVAEWKKLGGDAITEEVNDWAKNK